MRWQAPEVVRVRWEKPKENDPALNTTLNTNTDMYALGCIFLEVGHPNLTINLNTKMHKW